MMNNLNHLLTIFPMAGLTGFFAVLTAALFEVEPETYHDICIFTLGCIFTLIACFLVYPVAARYLGVHDKTKLKDPDMAECTHELCFVKDPQNFHLKQSDQTSSTFSNIEYWRRRQEFLEFCLDHEAKRLQEEVNDDTDDDDDDSASQATRLQKGRTRRNGSSGDEITISSDVGCEDVSDSEDISTVTDTSSLSDDAAFVMENSSDKLQLDKKTHYNKAQLP